MIQNDKSHENRTVEERKQPGTLRRWLPWVLTIAASVVLGWIILDTSIASQKIVPVIESMGEEIKQLDEEIQDAEFEVGEFESLRAKSRVWRQQLRQIYKQYRAIDDFALNSSELTIFDVASSGGFLNDSVRLTLPEGKFKFVSVFEKLALGERPKQPLIVRKGPDHRAFEFELDGPASYLINMVHQPLSGDDADSEPRQLLLVIESNLPGFETVSRKIFKPFRRPNGSSARGQVETVVLLTDDPAAAGSRSFGKNSVQLNGGKWLVRENLKTENGFELNYEMYLMKLKPAGTGASAQSAKSDK